MKLEEILKAVLEGEIDSEDKLDEILKASKVSDKGIAAAKGAVRLLQAFKDELPAGIVAKLAKIAGIQGADDEDEEKPKFPFPEKANKEELAEWFEAMPEELKKQFTPEEEPEENSMSKTKDLPEEVQAILKERDDELEALKAKNVTIEKALKTEQDSRALSVWIAKAEKECSHYPGKSTKEMGEMLKALDDVNPKMAQDQFESMKKASDALKSSDILKTAGSANAVSGGSAWDKIETLAAGLVEKSDDLDFTKEKAIDRILESDRGQALYKQYLDENPRQSAAN